MNQSVTCQQCGGSTSRLYALDGKSVCSMCWNDAQYDKREARMAEQRRKKDKPNEQVAASPA